MKAAQKKGKFGLAVKVLLFAAVLVFGLSVSSKFLLAKILETAIGAPVKISKFYLNLFSSEVGIYGLEIKNPKGFKEPTLASVPEIFIHMDLPGIFQNRIHVREVRLNLDEITVERSAKGLVNLTEIGAVKKSSQAKPSGEPAPPSPGAPSQAPPDARAPAQKAKPPAFQIDTVVLSLGRARYVDFSGAEPLIRTFPLEINNAVLKNVTDPAQITQQIVFKTLQRVGLDALAQHLKQFGLDWDAQAANAGEQLKQAWDDLKTRFTT